MTVTVSKLAAQLLRTCRLRRASAVLSLLLAGALPVAATLDPGALQQALQAYGGDPATQADALLALVGTRVAEVPPTMRILVADAALRLGKASTARAYLLGVLESDAGNPWDDWSRLALGWLALNQRDSEQARRWFAEVADGGGQSQMAATLGLALVSASQQDGGAGSLFDDVLERTPASDPLHQAAALGAAYAAYWGGDVPRARAAFDALAEQAPESRFADDARYASAWMDVHLGATDAAREAFRELGGAAEDGAEPGVRHTLLNLEPRALVREGTRRYRQSRVAPPEQQLANVLDGDGARMARAALLLLDDPETTVEAARPPLREPAAGDEPAPPAAVDAPPPPDSRAAPARPTAAARPGSSEPTTGGRRLGGWLGWLVALAVAVVALASLRRRGGRT